MKMFYIQFKLRGDLIHVVFTLTIKPRLNQVSRDTFNLSMRKSNILVICVNI